jgi:hypothetical protein
MKINVYYSRKDYFREFILGDVRPTISNLPKTHAYITTVEAEDLEDVFLMMQADNWSSDGISALLVLGHTSMSVGDVVQIDGTQEFFVCAPLGFDRLVEVTR